MKRTILIYLALLALFGSGIFVAIKWGQRLPAPTTENTSIVCVAAPVPSGDPVSFWSPVAFI